MNKSLISETRNTKVTRTLTILRSQSTLDATLYSIDVVEGSETLATTSYTVSVKSVGEENGPESIDSTLFIIFTFTICFFLLIMIVFLIKECRSK